jgi:hypothetical protein
MKLAPIQSSALVAIGYDAEHSVLAVEYESGAVYEYYDVPRSLYEGLLAAQPHPWSVYGEQVKAHRFRQVS